MGDIYLFQSSLSSNTPSLTAIDAYYNIMILRLLSLQLNITRKIIIIIIAVSPHIILLLLSLYTYGR